MKLIRNWFERHRHPVSLVLHAVGIPLTVAGVCVMIFAVGWRWWGIGGFVGGYALQFVGHAIEGNDAGEMILVKKCLRRPYRAIAEKKSQG